MRRRILRGLPGHSLFLCFLLVPSPPAVAQPEEAYWEPAAEELEEALALLVESDRWIETGADGERRVVADAELVFEKVADDERPPGRLVQITEYLYDSARALVSLVDLGRREVLEVREIPAGYAGLAEEEFHRARELAGELPVVREWMEAYGDELEVDVLLTRGNEVGPRVVELFYSISARFFTGPRILVDLTTDEVWIEGEENDVVTGEDPDA